MGGVLCVYIGDVFEGLFEHAFGFIHDVFLTE
jgi:hypothetical protein